MNILKTFYAYVLIALLTLVGCGPSPYLKASGDFATAMDNSVSTLRGMEDLNSQLCQQRAQLDYLFHRLTNTNYKDTTKDGKPVYLYWANYAAKFEYEVPQSDGSFKKQSWETHCNQVKIADAVVDKALSGLTAYANALKTVSTKDFSGTGVKSLADDATNLAGKLGAPSKATDIAKTLANPLGQLSGALLQKYAEHKAAEVVKAADAGVTEILDGVGKYIDALLEEELATDHDMRDYLNATDKGLTGSMEILQFSDLASRWMNDLQAKKDTQQKLAGVLKKLQKAEVALATAGKQEKPDTAAELKTVLENASIVISDIQALNNAMQGKGGNKK
jgi:uncharacterized protein YeaO (DUF488 family)